MTTAPCGSNSLNDANTEFEIRDLIQAGYRYALSLTHQRHDAEDLIQQACVKILAAHDNLIGKRYLFVTIRNLFIDRLRRGRETQLADDAPELITDTQRNHVSQTNDRLDIEQMLACLRADEREALYLNIVEGYTAAEIAELTGQPRDTTLSHLAIAKKRLQQMPLTRNWRHHE